jgi:hypothetical protein
MAPRRPSPLLRRETVRAILPVALATCVLAFLAIRGVYARVGHAAAALDDAYIHFQYARAFVEGHPFRYQAGEPISSGATSLLWPLALAPFWALGARDVTIVWGAWLLSFASWGALAWEAWKITLPLTSRAQAIGAAALVLSFGGFAWCASSGMEVVAFAWLLARSARRASEWVEGKEPPRLGEMIALGLATPLMRPEGAIASVLLAAALAIRPLERSARGRALGLLPLAGPLLMPMMLRVATGSAMGATAQVKLLWGNPYYEGAAFWATVSYNARLLAGTLLNGEVWSAEFLPRGGAPFAFAGLFSVVACGIKRNVPFRAACVFVLAFSMFVPCTYVTFLWNRLRYLWPFATGWLVGLACLAFLLGELAASVRPRWRIAGTLVSGVFVGLLGSKLEWTLQDAADSASGIDRQQVKLGRWAKRELPESARIGVNDTGAIAYMSDRRTFDIVGLTTPGEGRYWVAGVGSRLEHYERLGADRLPTHFIVYPEWMGFDAFYGATLTEATVTDATILGGQTMRAYVADWSKLGSGEEPWTPLAPIVDRLDVADLESEAEHGYELLGARDGEQVAAEGPTPGGETVIDGGRTGRTRERFVARLREGLDARALVRVDATATARVDVFAEGERVGSFSVEPTWSEQPFVVPARLARPRTQIELRAKGGALTVFHYWFAQGS